MYNNENLCKDFEIMADQMKADFTAHMWWEDMEWYGEWIANDPSGVADFWEGSYFFHLSDMYEVLKYQYKPTIVKAYYDYGVYYSWENREYALNLKSFSKLWDGSNVENWAKTYHIDREKNRMFWESPGWRAKEAEIIKPAYEQFEKDIQQYIDNKK